MAYNIDTSKASIPEALEILTDAVLNPKFQAWEVAEQVGCLLDSAACLPACLPACFSSPSAR
jgi:predicted Zn-dependent peptidase